MPATPLHPGGESVLARGKETVTQPSPEGDCVLYQRRETATPPSPEGDRKGPHPSSTLPPPLQRLRRADELPRIFVRAGAVWSGVGTLAVALGVGLGLIATIASLSRSSYSAS